MSRRLILYSPKILLAIALMLTGTISIYFLNQTELVIAGSDLTSIALLLSALIAYAGIVVIVTLFENESLLSVALLLPSIIAVAIFVYGFIGWSVRASLSAWKGLIPDYTFVGLQQYIDLFHDPRFMIDVRNTAVFTIGFLIGCIVLGLGLAILLDQKLRGEALFRGIFLFPMAISFIASGVVWGWLMNPATGNRITGINLIFQSLGLDFLVSRWHSTPPPWGMAFVVIPAVWQLTGFTMALYLGGIRSISEEIREAARVDGASEFQIYRYVIMPLLQPVTLSAVIILGHMSLKIFDLVVAIGSKDLRLDVPGIYMWTTTFDGTNYAQGAAIGILMLISVAVLVIPYLVYSMRTEAKAMTGRRIPIQPVYYLILIAMAVFFLLPVYLMVLTGFKPFNEVDLQTMWDLPTTGLHIDNFIAGFRQLAPNLKNSLVMVLPAAVLSAFLGSFNGYLLSKWKFRGSDLIFSLILFGMFIPYQSILIPLVKFMQFIGLYGDLPGLVLVHIIYGIPITTLIFRNYYAGISTEIIEASRIDGAALMGIYRHIILPLSAPGFAVVIIWQFTQAWNEFLFAVILTNQSNWPVTVALNNLAGSQLVQWNVLMAATFLAALPTLLVYIFLGRYFLRGLMAGALKG